MNEGNEGDEMNEQKQKRAYANQAAKLAERDAEIRPSPWTSWCGDAKSTR